jgi:hypothetical protein
MLCFFTSFARLPDVFFSSLRLGICFVPGCQNRLQDFENVFEQIWEQSGRSANRAALGQFEFPLRALLQSFSAFSSCPESRAKPAGQRPTAPHGRALLQHQPAEFL